MPHRYYRALAEDVEVRLLSDLVNLNEDRAIDALGWPWFRYGDMSTLLNRTYNRGLTVNGIDCMVRNGDSWDYDVTLEPSALSDDLDQSARNWFFEPFKDRVEKLRDAGSLHKAAFSCTISR